MKRYLPFLLIAGVLALALGGTALYLSRSTSITGSNASINVRADAAAAPSAAADERPPHFKGPVDAAVRLEEFGDFQCPPCGKLHPILQKIEANYGSRIRFSFRQFPLEIHRNAAVAARAAEAAGTQGKFWEMHDLLYEKQDEWKDATDARALFTGYARTLGLDVNRFAGEIDATPSSMRIIVDRRRADTLGVTGTPSVFLNDREVPFASVMNYDTLSAAIEEALKSKSQ